jgi:thymidylate synthase (FAD)
MAQVQTKVILLSMTPNPGELLEKIASVSYRTQHFAERIQPEMVRFASGRMVPAKELYGKHKFDIKPGEVLPGYTKDDMRVAEVIPATHHRVVKFILAIGHHALLRNMNATFLLENITRKAALHILRYQFSHFNMQSQKYQPQDQFNYLLPDDVPEHNLRRIEFYMQQAQAAYEELAMLGLDPEWSRGVYPNNIAQTMTMTTNFEQWRHIFDCLCDDDYVMENKDIMIECLKILKEEAPDFFHDYKWRDEEQRFAKRSAGKYSRNKKVNWVMPASQKKEFGLFVPEPIPGEETEIP